MAWTAGQVLTAALLNAYLPQTWAAWTPTITASSGTFTTTSAVGRYIAIGKTIHWSATIEITTVGSASGAVRFTIPVSAADSNAHIGSGRVFAGGGAMLQVNLASTATAEILNYSNASVIGAGVTLTASGTYEAA